MRSVNVNSLRSQNLWNEAPNIHDGINILEDARMLTKNGDKGKWQRKMANSIQQHRLIGFGSRDPSHEFHGCKVLSPSRSWQAKPPPPVLRRPRWNP